MPTARLLRVGGLVGLVALTATGCSGEEVLRFGWPEPVTPQAERMSVFWTWSTIAALVVGVIVWALILSFQRIRLLQIRRLDVIGGDYTLRNYDLLLNSADFLDAARTTLFYAVFGTLGA